MYVAKNTARQAECASAASARSLPKCSQKCLHFCEVFLDDVLGGKNAGQLVGGCLVSALEHRARALLGRRKGGQNVGGRTGQTDRALVDQGVILQRLVGHRDQRLAVGLERAADGQVAGLVQLLDAGE